MENIGDDYFGSDVQILSSDQVDTKKKEGNFSIEEDIFLCKAWAGTSGDSVRGNGQTSMTFWERVGQEYTISIGTNYAQRLGKSLPQRWSRIRTAVTKFCATYKNICDRNPSGFGEVEKVSSLLDASIADVSWLQSVLDPHEGSNLSLPPITRHDPILAMLWSSIASVQMGHLHDQIDAANNLASLARDSDRNKQMIVVEGGVVPLLRLLKEGASSEAQVAAATALLNLGNDHERVQCIASELAVPMIVQVLGDSPIRVQIAIANLAAKMAETDPTVQEELGKANIIRHLVTLLSMDVGFDDPEHQLNKDPVKDPLKFELKASCAKVLWKLSKGSLLNSRKITETKGLLILAKLIEKDQEELQVNCLMALMEITLVAESNSELRRTAFKPNSPAAKAVLEQLLRVINTETSQQLLIPSMRSIGALSRTFPAKETRMIKPLVAKLAHRNTNVAVEATIALIKFTSPEDYNCKAHSKAMVDFEGVSKLMNLIRTNGRDQVNEVVLLCYLALHVGNNKAFEQAQALGFLQKTARSMVAHHPELRDLFTKALHHLTLYQTGEHTLRQANEP